MPTHPHDKPWIRGVNIGGWLLAERFITPYLFAVNTCHLQGQLCSYPGQDGYESNPCHPTECLPVRPYRVMDGNADYHPRHEQPYNDYPRDEYTLGQVFANRTAASLYMQRHWDTFVTYDDLVALKEAGVTHLRVPMSFWIRNNDIRAGEPWIPGAWPYFVRFGHWCQRLGLEIWADLHGAPGSENGFDNSGQYLGFSTCAGWSESAENIQRTTNILTDIALGIADEGLADIVTGFGLLNEPFLDCDEYKLKNYYNQGLEIVRTILGQDTAVFIGDMFQSWKFNNPNWWQDPKIHANTYLDSHPYHVFFETGRAFTPRQHIAYVCRHNHQDVTSCCYQDAPDNNTIPSQGISRIVGEWSAAYDALPTALTPHIMEIIALTGSAPLWNRTLSIDRQAFMRSYVEAQMVTYEARDAGVSRGWLFWNFKMEGGAFAEWDFLRGIREGWMPPIPDPTVASEDLYGSCYDIYNRTNDDYSLIVEEYPDPRTLDWTKYQGWDATDDFVLSDPLIPKTSYGTEPHPHSWMVGLLAGLVGAILAVMVAKRLGATAGWLESRKRRDRAQYAQLK